MSMTFIFDQIFLLSFLFSNDSIILAKALSTDADYLANSLSGMLGQRKSALITEEQKMG